MRFCFFGPDGHIESSHNDDTVEVLPEGAFELTEANWDDRFYLLMRNGEVIKAEEELCE